MLKIYEKFDAPALLRYLTPEDCSLLFAATESYKYSKGEHIIFDEDSEAILYLIEEGKVDILVKQGSESVSVAILGQGDIIGDMSFLMGVRRSADAVALEEATIRFIEPERIGQTFKENEGFSARFFYSISQILAERVIRGNQKLASLETPQSCIKLKVKAPSSIWAQNSFFHVQQKIKHVEDGITLSFPYADQPALIRQIIALGPDCEVIEPQRFRSQVAQAARQIVALYD